MSSEYIGSYVSLISVTCNTSKPSNPLVNGDVLCVSGANGNTVQSQLPGEVNVDVQPTDRITYDKNTDILNFRATCSNFYVPTVVFDKVVFKGLASGSLFPKKRIATCDSNEIEIIEPKCNTIFGLNEQTSVFHIKDEIIGDLSKCVVPYDLTFFYPDAFEEENVPLGMIMVPRKVLLKSGLPGSLAKCLSIGAGSLTIEVNGNPAGSIDFTGSSLGSIQFPSDIMLNAGDLVLIKTPGSIDPELKNVAITLVGLSMVGSA